MFELLSATADNLFAFLRSALFAFFASLYCPVRWFPQKRKLTIITFAVTRLLLQILVFDHWNPYETADIGILGKQLVYLSVAILWVALFFRAERTMVFLIPVLIISISDICMFLSNEFLQFSSMLISRFDPLLAEERIDSDTYLFYVHLTVLLSELLFWMMHLLVMALVLKMIVRRFPPAKQRLQTDEFLFVLVPTLAFWLICQLLRTVMMTIDDAGVHLLYDDHPILLIVIPVLCGMMIAAILLDIQVLQMLRKNTRERSERMILEGQIRSLANEIQVIGGKNDSLRRFRHDIRNHLAVLSSLQNQGKLGEYKDYLANLTNEMEETESSFHTGNVVADTILSIMQEKASALDPAVVIETSDLLLPERICIEDYDLGILLSNALDNSVDACGRMKPSDSPAFIRLQSETIADMLFLKISNSFAGEISERDENGFPVTVKQPSDEHGLGMENMKRVIDKCHGGMEYQAENGVFTLTFMLQTRDVDLENNS